MNPEEMKAAWEILDRRLAAQNRLSLQSLKDNRIGLNALELFFEFIWEILYLEV